MPTRFETGTGIIFCHSRMMQKSMMTVLMVPGFDVFIKIINNGG